MLSRSNAFVSFSVKSRKFRFQETDIYYYRMSLVITKDEFLSDEEAFGPDGSINGALTDLVQL